MGEYSGGGSGSNEVNALGGGGLLRPCALLPLLELFGLVCQKCRVFELIDGSSNESFGAGSLCFPVLSFRHYLEAAEVNRMSRHASLVSMIGSRANCRGFAMAFGSSDEPGSVSERQGDLDARRRIEVH